MQEHSVELKLGHPDDAFHLFGSNERHLRLMEQELKVTIHARTEPDVGAIKFKTPEADW